MYRPKGNSLWFECLGLPVIGSWLHIFVFSGSRLASRTRGNFRYPVRYRSTRINRTLACTRTILHDSRRCPMKGRPPPDLQEWHRPNYSFLSNHITSSRRAEKGKVLKYDSRSGRTHRIVIVAFKVMTFRNPLIGTGGSAGMEAGEKTRSTNKAIDYYTA